MYMHVCMCEPDRKNSQKAHVNDRFFYTTIPIMLFLELGFELESG